MSTELTTLFRNTDVMIQFRLEQNFSHITSRQLVKKGPKRRKTMRMYAFTMRLEMYVPCHREDTKKKLNTKCDCQELIL